MRERTVRNTPAHYADGQTALRTGDANPLWGAMGQLDLIGPSRIRTRVGEETEPPPPDVLERVNRLVHTLRSAREPEDLAEVGPATGDRPH
ncbi:CATRA system-associated protein [Streptomyces sp. NPDC088760]|uniref:CATRA system-associated protein n=1 Tax=Streptomyces sp. NPDC088760 TaxID=3365890 RepID=UPI0038151FA5